MEHIVINIFDRDLVIVSQDESIIAVCFKSQPNYQYFLNNSRENVRSKLLQSVRDQLIKYSNVRSDFSISLRLRGTEFQKAVWNEIAKIPYGETLSYSQIANSLALPKASRAVANAIAKNPVIIISPCHRVIRANGDLGGYSAGGRLKELLLLHEASLV